MDFSNKNINLLTLHSGIWRFANNIFDVFSAVYLLGLGLSFPVVALAMVCSLILRSILRPLSMMLSEKIGIKKALIFGVVVSSGLFLVLAKVHSLNFWLYFYAFYLSLHDITYWLPYHAFYSSAGDEEKRGKQVGPQQATVAIFRTLAPLAGGLMIAHLGFWSLYLSATIIMLFSAIPLFYVNDITVGKSIGWREALKSIDKKGMIMQMGDGVLYIHDFIWTIIVFYLVGNYVTFGGLITFELFATVLLALFLGYFVDKGKGKKIAVIGLVGTGIIILFRGLYAHTIPQIIFSDILIAFSATFYSSSYSVAFYNLAKESKNTLWFQFFGELGWDIGAMVSLALGTLLFCLGVPFRFFILFSLPGLLIVYYVLKKYYNNKN